MNPKMILAFGAGAILASGIVLVAVKSDPPKTAFASATVTQPVQATTEPAAAIERLPADRPGYDKPSPSRRKERAEVARVQPAAPPGVAAPQAPPPPAPEVRNDVARNDPPRNEAPRNDPPPPAPSIPPPPPEPHSVTLNAGTALQVRVGETLSTKKNKTGDTFLATLSQPLVVDGFVIAEKGARAEGRIVESDPGGKVKGVSHLTLELTKVTTSDGQHVAIRTVSYSKDGDTAVKKDAAKVGIGAALGAVIGAVAGGGKGAAIGSGVGGAAGAGDVMMTRGPEAVVPVETRLTFKVQEPVTITEKLP